MNDDAGRRMAARVVPTVHPNEVAMASRVFSSLRDFTWFPKPGGDSALAGSLLV
jgi:hypothetical protein